MQAIVRAKCYTESVGAKVNPSTARAVEEAARMAGLKRGEWVRRAIEDGLKAKPNINRTVLAEMLSMRAIVLTILKDGVGAERLEAIVREADSKRFVLADGRIEKAVGQ